MILYGHDPALHLTIYVFLVHCPHIYKINLKAIAKLRRKDRLLCPFPCLNCRCFLVANVAIITVNLAQFIHRAVEHWLASSECLVNTKMALLTMSFFDDVEYVKHVEDDATGVLALKYDLL